MARDDDDNYKAGVDFEWVTAKGSNYKTRKFFTKAEKEAMKAPKKESKPASKPASKSAAPTTSIRPKSKPVDAMKGYRKGDVTTSRITSNVVDGADKAVKRAEIQAKAKKVRERADFSLGKTDKGQLGRYGSALGKPVAPFDVTYAQWKEMPAANRRKLGLPVSVVGGELGFNRLMTGITGKEYKMRTK